MTDLLTLGLDESVSMFANLAFREVFYADNRTSISANDDSKNDDIDILSMNQPYEEKRVKKPKASQEKEKYGSDDDIFWQDFF